MFIEHRNKSLKFHLSSQSCGNEQTRERLFISLHKMSTVNYMYMKEDRNGRVYLPNS